MTKDNFLVFAFFPRIVFFVRRATLFFIWTRLLFDARLLVFCSFYNSFIIFTIFIVIEMLILTAVMSMRLYINPAYIILRL
jgi:hypothetical protein